MGRGRGKGKKSSVREDLGSGEEEKIPLAKRRGRPLKPAKDELEEEDEGEKVVEDEENGDNMKSNNILSKDVKNQTADENGKKRKRPSQVKENVDSVKEEKGQGTKTNADDLIKSVGFRQNGSRRKSKPRRAAEVGVECR